MKAYRFSCPCNFDFIIVQQWWFRIIIGPFWEGDTVHVMTYGEFEEQYGDCSYRYELKRSGDREPL